MSVRHDKTLERPAVLLVETAEKRRRFLSEGLTRAGYEVIPATSPEEGLRFAAGLGPSVIVGPSALVEEGGADLPRRGKMGGILEHLRPGDALERTLVLLGDGVPDDSLPDEVRLVRVRGLPDDEILRRIRMVLLGREIGVETDLAVRSLVGDLALFPFLELVRSLHHCRLTGRLVLEGGGVAFERGEIIAARVGSVRGAKAFCRLGRRRHGPFRLMIGLGDVTREMEQPVPDLVIEALEEINLEPPPPNTRIRALEPPRDPADSTASGHSTWTEGLLVDVVARCNTVGEFLDGLPTTDSHTLKALDKLVKMGLVKLERPAAAVTVVTDSTADLPPEVAAAHDIVVVPLSVIFGQEALRDGVDIRPRDFYQMLVTEPHHPSTRPPDEAEFYEHYLGLAGEQDIVSVHISSLLSQTFEHARRAALAGARSFNLPEARKGFALEVIDSRTVSGGLGLLALFAARMAVRGEKVFAITRRLQAMAPRIHILFVLDTLDYLARGGRIGKARAWMGKLLGIKAILGVVDGEVVPIDRVRGGRRAHPRLVEILRQRVDPGRPVVTAVAHGRAPVWADRLGELVEDSFEVAEMLRIDIGPVVGTHTGPGSVGTVVFQPTAEEWELIRPLD